MKRYKQYLRNKGFLLSLVATFLLLGVSLILNFYAGNYATERASNTVTDIILSNIRAYDVHIIFLYGSIALWVFVAFLLIWKPERIPFTLKAVSTFVIIRAIFISLTHLAPPPLHIILPPENILDKITFGGDLFFSGHTGLPFLLALIFWEDKVVRYTMLVSSLVFGAVVLMGHLHYSIDVFGAYFITYSIFHISEFIFKRDRILFREGLTENKS